METSEHHSIVELRQILDEYFNDGELRTLCFDLDIDYDSLPGEGKADRARELVAYTKRHSMLPELTLSILQRRPRLKGGVDPTLGDVLEEYSTQVNDYLTKFVRLHKELEEWKELHHWLHTLYRASGELDRYAAEAERISIIKRIGRQKREELMHQSESGWRMFRALVTGGTENLASSIRCISDPYDPDTGDGPRWFLELAELFESVDETVRETEVSRFDFGELARQLFTLKETIHQWIQKADTNLVLVVQKINELASHPFLGQKR